jgi:hypothetical protein
MPGRRIKPGVKIRLQAKPVGRTPNKHRTYTAVKEGYGIASFKGNARQIALKGSAEHREKTPIKSGGGVKTLVIEIRLHREIEARIKAEFKFLLRAYVAWEEDQRKRGNEETRRDVPE